MSIMIRYNSESLDEICTEMDELLCLDKWKKNTISQQTLNHDEKMMKINWLKT